ncbi:hypothetical protein GGI42DRAFT_91544 [Trichoderma sp. SZMC 28013]
MVVRRQSSPEPIELHAFIEELPVDFLKRRVVEPDSAKIPGYDWETIPANHLNMTKFRTASDVGYKRVLNILTHWIGDDEFDDKSMNMQYIAQLREVLQVQWPNSNSSDLIREISCSSDIQESLEWLLNSSEYHTWKQATSSKLLIHGEHKDGKTVAMSYVLNRLEIESRFRRDVDIVSVFCSNGDSELGMVASLTVQLLRKNNLRANGARKNVPIFKFKPHTRMSAIWDLLRSSIISVSTETVFIIDGIDKLDNRVRSSFLENFRQTEKETDESNIPLRVLISSQTINDIMSKLAHYSSIDREKERRGTHLASISNN